MKLWRTRGKQGNAPAPASKPPMTSLPPTAAESWGIWMKTQSLRGSGASHEEVRQMLLGEEADRGPAC
jgi:hypothetical protein